MQRLLTKILSIKSIILKWQKYELLKIQTSPLLKLIIPSKAIRLLKSSSLTQSITIKNEHSHP